MDRGPHRPLASGTALALTLTLTLSALAVAVAVAASGALAGGRGHQAGRLARGGIASRHAVARPGRGRWRYAVAIQAVFDARGNPVLVANFTPDGSLARPAWSICRPAALGRRQACVFAAAPIALQPGREPAGTRFLAWARFRGRRYVASVTWRGRVRALARPGVDGTPRVGAAVLPLPGRWAGGWGTESDQLGLEACRTRSGRHCVMLSGGQAFCPPAAARARIPARFRGWYVFALDARSAHDEVCAGIGYGSPEAVPAWPVGETVARSAPVGPIRGR